MPNAAPGTFCLCTPRSRYAGKQLPRSAARVSLACRNAAVAASSVGLLLSARSIKALSAGDWNRVHHWPGMSSPATKFCALTGRSARPELCRNLARRREAGRPRRLRLLEIRADRAGGEETCERRAACDVSLANHLRGVAPSKKISITCSTCDVQSSRAAAASPPNSRLSCSSAQIICRNRVAARSGSASASAPRAT